MLKWKRPLLFSSTIARAKNDNDVLESVQRIFGEAPTAAVLLVAENDNLRIAQVPPWLQRGGPFLLPEWIKVSPAEISDNSVIRLMVEEVSKLSALNYAQYHPELVKLS